MLTTKDILTSEPATAILDAVIQNDTLRGAALKFAEKKLHEELLEKNPTQRPLRVQEEKFCTLRNMFYSIDRALRNKTISPQVRKGLLKILVGNVLLEDNNIRKAFREKYSQDPPTFLTISPEKKCNLRCIGCYASSSATTDERLDYDIVHRIITEKTQLWGSHFTVISGGEPLLWKSQGKTIIDFYREHSDNYFLMYTNGTLIDRKMARQMAEVGNVTPAISVEGLEKETEQRRGKGVYKQILKAFENLREAGVPFGISITATTDNADLVVSDEFIDFYFERQGAVYGWIFQYMPIGRSFTLDLMVTPEQRLRMYQREQYLLREKKIFIADFWNSGPVSNGCIAGGRPGGYFYIDWNGDVMPCVFFPYSTHNIVQVYKEGGDLNTVLFSPFFNAIRKWQRGYGYMKPADRVGNQIVPCAIRDHHQLAHGVIKHFGARPVDKPAAEAITDEKYYRKLVAYGKKVDQLTHEIWERDYLGRRIAQAA